MVATLADIPNASLIAKRLLRNQDEIGNAIAPYYGKKAGKKLAKLLRDHILIATELVSAAKEGDQAKFKKANSRWYKNAQDIGAFLSKANRYWPQKEPCLTNT